MFNKRGQSPCDMAGYLYSACRDEPVTVTPLEPGHYYGGPVSSPYATPCACSTVTWSLFCACATCQNGTTAAWSVWTKYCASELEMTFPVGIPSQTVVPHWAYLNYGEYEVWDMNAAKADAGAEKSQKKSSAPIGAIVGGAICGIVIVAILIGIYVVTCRRRAAARCSVDGPDSTGLLSTPASTSVGSEPSMHQRSYNPSDPATFPPPYCAPSATTYPSSPGNSLGYERVAHTANDRIVVY